MALRKIALQGEPCLTKVCRPVTEFNDRLHVLLDDLADRGIEIPPTRADRDRFRTREGILGLCREFGGTVE